MKKEAESNPKKTLRKKLATHLLRELAPASEKMVVVRTKSAVSFIEYSLSLLMLLVFGFFFLLPVLDLLMEVLLLIIYWKDFSTWSAWGQGFSQFFWHIVLREENAPVSRPAWWLAGFFLSLLLLACSFLLMRYFWRQFYRLWVYTRAKDPKAFVPQPNLTVIPSLWVSSKVLTEIEPDDAMNLVEEDPEIWETTVAAWRQKHPPEPAPLARIQIRLTQRCEIILTGQNGKTAAFFLRNAKYTELLAFFALQSRDEWIAKVDFVPKLYGSNVDNFSTDISRLRGEINKKAQEHNLVLIEEMSLGQAEQRTIPISVLDQKTIQGRSCWRLMPGCTVEIFTGLQQLYEQAKEAQAQQQAVDLAAREQEMMDLVRDYGAEEGLMGLYQTDGSWEWIKEAYHHYRTMWLFLLTDTAEREMNQAASQPDTSQARQSFQDAARLYGWAVAATNSLFPRLALTNRSLEHEGEVCLIKALQCYRQLNDRQSARILYRDYREKRKSDWRPSQAIKDAWPEVFMPAQNRKKAAK
ncbi:MAG TPA: hypothetical protein VFN35_21060 [Ktedonobacteraceae bacterium]|nr:hypothetical protein [Ktedonobacteraceae bacterium]